MPYYNRCFAAGVGSKPRIFYYAARRGLEVPPTMVLEKVDGLGQGLVTSTTVYGTTTAQALEPVREHLKDVAVMPAFVDDLTSVVKIGSILDSFDRTRAQLLTTGGELMMSASAGRSAVPSTITWLTRRSPRPPPTRRPRSLSAQGPCRSWIRSRRAEGLGLRCRARV